MGIAGLGEIADRLRRSTVLVRPGGSKGTGSGVLWSSDGLIVTNAHVAQGSRAEISLWDGREFRAEVTSRDARRDLAALRISAGELFAAEAGDSSRVRPGEIAIAVGNPLGFVGALTTGVVHAVGPIRGLGSQNWVQSDVRLAPGNSGGPLADARGRVIGINAMVAGRFALAIASNEVARFLNGESAADALRLGVSVMPVRLPRSIAGRRFGLVLALVEPGTPAARASLLQGDILLGTEEKRFTSVSDLADALQGDTACMLRLEFLRGDYERVRRVSVQVVARGQKAGAIAA
ncbi:MAG TPA: trypsin-like peptidase domain-containing protein [Candidatus Acidoferrum sp.]|jgi:serine protease Do